MKRLIAFISILMLISGALATSTSITIYGTNKSNAQDNVTCYGCNNTISVQAWNTSYVKNITVESKNGTGGDVVSFNISNVTAFQVQELKVNKTAVNAYQAGANGMLNFSYTVSGNKTLVLSPAVNMNGYNMTWLWMKTGIKGKGPFTTQNASGCALNTVYQNTDSTTRFVNAVFQSGGAIAMDFLTDASNPPTTSVWKIPSSAVTTYSVFGMVLPNNYYKIETTGTPTLNTCAAWS